MALEIDAFVMVTSFNKYLAFSAVEKEVQLTHRFLNAISCEILVIAFRNIITLDVAIVISAGLQNKKDEKILIKLVDSG